MALCTAAKRRDHGQHWRIAQPPDDIGALERYQQEQRDLRAQHAVASAGEMSS
jgi:hypothetical protein